MQKRICGTQPGQAEYTICGMAYDAHDSGDAEEPINLAQPGQTINCPDCRSRIDYFKAMKGYKEPHA